MARYRQRLDAPTTIFIFVSRARPVERALVLGGHGCRAELEAHQPLLQVFVQDLFREIPVVHHLTAQ
jgi:hypothetical protein